jgi:hypothetical protein
MSIGDERCACGAYPYHHHATPGQARIVSIRHRAGCEAYAAELLADARDEAERDAEAAYDAVMGEGS